MSIRRYAAGVALALPLWLVGCTGGSSDSDAAPPLPDGVPRSEKVAAPAGADPVGIAAGGSGMPVPSGGSGSAGGAPVVLKDANADPVGAAAGGSGMPIPSNK